MINAVSLNNITFAPNKGFVLIAGPCVIEDEDMIFSSAEFLQKLTKRLDIPFIFKASYDKANRTSVKSYRGPGLEKGLDILKKVKDSYDVPILSDVHCVNQLEKAAEVLDILQIPAFLCRQTDLLLKAAETGKVVNVKKAQFLAPEDMKAVVDKIYSKGNKNVLLTERGTIFGYHNLVVDFRSLEIMHDIGCPVIFDATHSVQQPGGLGNCSGGKSQYVPSLAKAAMAIGCEGLFLEVHPNPQKALSDGPNMLALDCLEELLVSLKRINEVNIV